MTRHSLSRRSFLKLAGMTITGLNEIIITGLSIETVRRQFKPRT